MKSIFLTGGAGFIGSAFVRLVLDSTDDIKIVNFDALTYAGNMENLAGVDERRHSFVKGDICQGAEVLAAIPDGCDAIFNFAAESHVDRSITSAGEFLQTNVIGTQVLLDAAREKNVRRFLQISTDEVMGSLPEESDELFTENAPLRPNSPYAASKAAAEMVIRAARETFAVDTVITRCGNNYGPRQFPEKLIPLMIANAMNDEPLPVYGDGRNVRDWIHVDDHCRAIWLAYQKGRPGTVYNVGARNELHNIDVVRSILDALGKPHDLIRFVVDRAGHDRRYAIDPALVEQELGWSPRVSWSDGLAATIAWYGENREWVDHIRNGEYREYYQKMYGAGLGQVLFPIMKVLITGANGMVARACARLCRELGDEVMALTRAELDIGDVRSVDIAVEGFQPDVIINCAAYTDVDGAESNAKTAYRTNAVGPGNLATAAHVHGARFVTISTDYVFDGEKDGFYTELDTPRPQSVYASTKYKGEIMAAEANPNSVVVRSGWIYGHGGTNFLSVLDSLLTDGKSIKAIADSFGTPTFADDLAGRLRDLAVLNMPGIYHAVNSGPGTSYFGFADKVCEIGALDKALVEPVSSETLSRPAPRPRNSKLACLLSEQRGLPVMPDWEEALRRFIA